MKHIIKLALTYMARNGYSKWAITEILQNEGWMLITLAQFEQEDRNASA